MSTAWNSLAGRCEQLVNFGKLRLFCNCCGAFEFLLYSIGNFWGVISKEAILEEINHEDRNTCVGVYDGFGSCGISSGTCTDAHTRTADPVTVSGFETREDLRYC